MSHAGKTTQELLHELALLREENQRITEQLRCRHEAEDLKRSEEKFKIIADYTYDWESWIGPEGELRWVNPAGKRMTGYTDMECLAMVNYPEPIILKKDHNVIKRVRELVQMGEPGNDVQLRIVRKNGAVYWGAISWNPVFGGNGEPMGYRSSVRDITDRKNAELALRKSEASYRGIIDISPVAIAIHKDGRLLFCNKAGARLVGSDAPEKLVGATMLDALHPDFKEGSELRLLRAAESGEVQEPMEVQVLRADGTTRNVQVVTAPIIYENKDALITVGLDITEYKIAGKALRESEERYRVLYEQAQDAIFLMDAVGRVLDANPAALELLGQDALHVRGTCYVDLIHPDERFHHMEMFEAVLSGETRREECRFQGKQGEYVAAEASIKYISSNLVLSVVRDISARKRAEEDMWLHRTRLETLEHLHQMTDASTREIMKFVLEEGIKLTKSTVGFIGFIAENKHYLNVHAWSQGVHKACEVKDASVHLPVEKAGLWADAIRQKKTVVINHYAEYESTDKKGFPKGHVELERFIAVPVLENDEIAALVVVGNKGESYDRTDVSQLLLLINGMWNHIKAKRAKEELVKAKVDAEDASQSKGLFLANMSHEIRSPMSGIIGMTEMVLSTGVRDDQREYLNMIKDSGKSLLNILNDILDLSKIEAKKLELRNKDFELGSSLDKIVSAFSMEASKKKCVLRMSMASSVPTHVHGDPDRLGQVVRNLVNNSLKFTENGKVELMVSRLDDQSVPIRLLFAVRDTGIGIPEERQGDIFRSFSQVDDEYTTKHMGTGLGLSICKRLVKMMNGTIWVESEYGKGSTFSFTAVFGKSYDQELGYGAGQYVSEGGADVAHPIFRILLADDNLMNQTFMNHFLQEAGHEVTCVGDGKKVLKALAESRYDCVLMDVQMPEMDGVLATKAIRSGTYENVDSSVPVIALTAHAMKGDKERFLDAGMDGYVSKPVEMEELLVVIRRIVASKNISNTSCGLGRKKSTTVKEDSGQKTPVLDKEKLYASFHAKKELFEEIRTLFMDSGPVKIKEIEDALHNDSLEAVAVAAHSLMNSAVVIRSTRMMDFARELEHAARDNNVDEVMRQYGVLKKCIEDVVDELRTFDFF